METLEIRKHLHAYIDIADERLLKPYVWNDCGR
jgi:hypothetical protein